MAVGDVLAQMITVPSSGTITFQPASGTEFCITSIIGLATPVFFNGTNSCSQTIALPFNGKLFLNNSVYLSFTSTGSITYSVITGVQTK